MSRQLKMEWEHRSTIAGSVPNWWRGTIVDQDDLENFDPELMWDLLPRIVNTYLQFDPRWYSAVPWVLQDVQYSITDDDQFIVVSSHKVISELITIAVRDVYEQRMLAPLLICDVLELFETV